MRITMFFAAAFCAATMLSSAGEASAASPKKESAVVKHPWAGKKVAFLGDSITDKGVLKDDTHYWAYLDQWLDITPLVYGISGHKWEHIPGQAQKLRNDHGDDFDAIMIFVGTNDYNAALPIGEWFTEEVVTVNADGVMVQRVRRTPVMDHSTFRGSINVVLDGLKRMFPDKQIVMMTPIHRGAASFGEDNVQPTEDHQNGCGEYLDAYIDSIKEASALWSVPVIDLYSLSGIYPMHEEQAIYVPGGTDWLHPNEKGHRRMAQCIYHQLLALPCVFDDMR